MSKPLVAVVGATGAQGGSVARALLHSGRYAVRALSRDENSAKARELKELGAEVVKADLLDKDSVVRAFEGVDAVFGLTQPFQAEANEPLQGRNLVDAVKAAGVKQFVFSTLESVSKLTGGKLSVPHFDEKGELEEYAKEAGLPGLVFVRLPAYFDNFGTHFALRPTPDGSAHSFGFPLGDAKMGGFPIGQLGDAVVSILDNFDEFNGQAIGLVSEFLTGNEYAAILTKHLGTPIVYNHIPESVFSKLPFFGADDLARMFVYYREYPLPRDAELTRRLVPGLLTFDEFVARNKERILASLHGGARHH